MTSKPGCDLNSGMSLAGVRLLARRCPACRWREPGLRRPGGPGEGARGYCPLCVAGGRGERPPGGDLEAAAEYPLPGVLADRPVVAEKAL